MTHTINVAKGFEVVVNVYDHCVISTVNYFGTSRKFSYNDLQDLIANTSIPKVAEFFNAL